ncbi:MAG: hypothetical protein JWR90_2936 [Marmoricola sp.]|nr:hypothetical protein [Marmoricola sp.]
MTDHELAVAGFWVSVIGSAATVAALIVAIVLGVHEARRLRRDALVRDADLREEAERRRRAPAESVSAQLHVEPQPYNELAAAYSSEPLRHHTWVSVFNRSALPIYDVEAAAPAPDKPGYLALAHAELVAGGQTGHLHVPAHPNRDENGRPVAVTFTDAAGSRWHRHVNGVLEEVAPSATESESPSAIHEHED